MIHRNALLNLRRDLEKGSRVYLNTAGSAVVVTEIVGVQDESHVVVISNNATVLVPLDHITSITVLPDNGGVEDLVE